MTTTQSTSLSFNLPNIEEEEIVILKDLRQFPYIRKEFISESVVISIVMAGESHGYYEHQPVTVHAHDVSVIMPYHTCMDEDTTDDYCVTLVIMSPGMVEEMESILNYRTRSRYHSQPTVHLTDEQFEIFLKAVHTLHDILQLKEMNGRHACIIHMIQVIGELLDYYRGEQNMAIRGETRSEEIFNQFYALLTSQYATQHRVHEYAAQLQVNPKYLSRCVQEATAHTANYWIESVIAVHAKQMLIHYSTLSVKAICYKLGFDEVSNFTRFFRRKTGYSPLQFRKEFKG